MALKKRVAPVLPLVGLPAGLSEAAMVRSSSWSIPRSDVASTSYTGVPEWRYRTSSPRTGRLLDIAVSPEPSHSGGSGRAPDTHTLEADGLFALLIPRTILCAEPEPADACSSLTGDGSDTFGLRASKPARAGNRLILVGAEFLD
jgi:hypothetical protein